MHAMEHPHYDSLILNVDDLVLHAEEVSIVGGEASQINNALDSPYWHDYERGKISK